MSTCSAVLLMRCSCRNGHAATGDECTDSPGEVCKTCNDGYFLVGKLCKPCKLLKGYMGATPECSALISDSHLPQATAQGPQGPERAAWALAGGMAILAAAAIVAAVAFALRRMKALSSPSVPGRGPASYEACGSLKSENMANLLPSSLGLSSAFLSARRFRNCHRQAEELKRKPAWGTCSPKWHAIHNH